MKIYFCPECGSYSNAPDAYCEECHTQLPEDSWAELSEEEIHQLEYVDEFDLAPGLLTWEYEVVKLKSDAEAGGFDYTTVLLNRMGEKGWELVNITPLGDVDGPRYAVFKRAWASEYDD